MIIITSKREGFRRCGVAHAARPVEWPDERWTIDDLVRLEDLQLADDPAVSDGASLSGETLDDHLNRVERQSILDALTKTGFNRTAAARLLGITFRSLRYRIERLGIEEDVG